MKIVVIFPTEDEGKLFSYKDVTVVYGGLGLTATAYTTTKAIYEHRPDIIIMAGIAGVYKHSSLKIGDNVLVCSEHEADLGFFYEDGFKHISNMCNDMSFEIIKEIDCPYIPQDIDIKTAKSNSMNAAMADFVDIDSAEIENMEGYALFYVCKKEGVKFLEIRSISNVVDKGREEWDYNKSIKNMTEALYKILNHITKA